ncbi:MAG TPA: mechanosensitive ion channel domain-containing protein [Planctomycetota bacterium]|nr:mechanosensitive ion channel domain-containing protein [Planctomycetota bacterium]
MTFLLALLGLHGAPAHAATLVQEAPEGDIPVAPVDLDGQHLFFVRGISSVPATERAAAIADRIRALAQDEGFDPATLRAAEVDGGLRVEAADGRIVMNIYDADSVRQGFSREGVAKEILRRVQQEILDFRAARTPEALLRSSWHAAGALVVLALGLWLVLRTARRIEARIEERFRAVMPRVGIGTFDILRAERIWMLLHTLTVLLRWVVVVLLTFLTVRYALGQFPVTRGMAEGLDDMVVGPLQRMGFSALAFLPDLIFLVILFLVTRWVLRLALAFFHSIERGVVTLQNFEREWAMPTYRLVRIGIIAFALVVAYPYIPGNDSAAFKGISLFLGVLISIGSSSTISNIVAGYMLTYRRAFRVGDRVRIGEVTGDVADVRLQVTQLRTVKNESITIPNSMILSSEVINYSALAQSHGLILHVTVGIGYETPWRQVEAMLLLAASRVADVKREPAPFVHQLALSDFAVTYELNAYTDTPQKMAALRSALHRAVLDVFNEYGIQIMTPAYEGDPEQAKVVPREHWYTAPARRDEPAGTPGS